MCPSEAEQQCVVREANEAVSLLRRTPGAEAPEACPALRVRRCGCVACVSLTRAEYEAVRAYGSHFAVGVNHENPEDACVLSETAQFEVIDVIGGDSRYHVLARNPRHAWSEGSDS